ncbi:group II truncated hemoglobin [Streptomyces sp. NPDC088197]|uniref:group II truncated hemoglobin n=1 Tax=unclassified Streptomyces TaxID=2593676 RepID=UPI0033A43FD4
MTTPDSPVDRTGTFYEAVGGSDALRRLIDSFYEQVLVDPLLAPVFVHFTRAHVDHVVVWLTEVFGGPAEYTARLGGHQALLSQHLDLRITEEQRARWVELMLATAVKELPADALLRQRFAEYIEWGTRIAMSVSHQESSDLGDPGPVPHWGWDGLAR